MHFPFIPCCCFCHWEFRTGGFKFNHALHEIQKREVRKGPFPNPSCHFFLILSISFFSPWSHNFANFVSSLSTTSNLFLGSKKSNSLSHSPFSFQFTFMLPYAWQILLTETIRLNFGDFNSVQFQSGPIPI